LAAHTRRPLTPSGGLTREWTPRFGRGNVLKIRPPLVISEDEADVLCDRLEQVFAAVAG
jgi:4-aminobutyrate aminotransferase-like enzyme